MSEITINNDYKIIDDNNKIIKNNYNFCDIIIENLKNVCCIFIIIIFIINIILYCKYNN